MLDNGYWNAFYKKANAVNAPSKFAQYCQDNLLQKAHLTVFEAGCGNGRDAQFFNAMGHQVTALDQSDEVIHANQTIQNNSDHAVNYIAGDFVSYLNGCSNQFDVVYSRFTMHAISSSQQVKFLKSCIGALKSGGKLCIEVRTINDELFGVGRDLGDNAYYSDHYRRFIDPAAFKSFIDDSEWKLHFFNEAKGYAPFADEDPPILRVMLEK